MVIRKKEMLNIVADKLQDSVSHEEIACVVEALLESISEQLGKGNEVVFRKFGAFRIKTTQAKVGRNPKKPTEEVVIPATTKVKFKVGKEMKERVASRQG